jgi:hypothetical protein
VIAARSRECSYRKNEYGQSQAFNKRLTEETGCTSLGNAHRQSNALHCEYNYRRRWNWPLLPTSGQAPMTFVMRRHRTHPLLPLESTVMLINGL